MPDTTIVVLAVSTALLGAALVASTFLGASERRHCRELLAARSYSEFANGKRLMDKPVAAPVKPQAGYLSVFDDAPPSPPARG